MPDFSVNPPAYYAGDRIAVTFQFKNDYPGLLSVIATFIHEHDRDEQIVLYSGKPEQRLILPGHPWEVSLFAEITAQHRLGTYSCASLQAEFRGGRMVRFNRPPNEDQFQIVEENIQHPEGLQWDWGIATS